MSDRHEQHEQHEQTDAEHTKSFLKQMKDDMDTMNDYVCLLKTEIDTMHERHADVVKDRDEYYCQLLGMRDGYGRQLEHVTEELSTLTDMYEKTHGEKETIAMELHHTAYELDVLRVDYYKEREYNEELKKHNEDLKRKYRNARYEMTSADRANTKLNARLVGRMDVLEKEREDLVKINAAYERELERREAICFVCRVNVNRVECESCKNRYCEACEETMTACPFCRTDIGRPLREEDLLELEL